MPLVYPFENAPGKAQAVDITPDIKWVRSPLPLSLDHINCYLLREDNGWCVVDTGMNGDAAKQQWLDIIESQLQGAPISRVIATHHHPDHVGLAGWFCDQYQVSLYMTESEYFYARTFNAPRRNEPYWEVESFFKRAGMSKDVQQELLANSDYNHMVSTVPGSYHQVKDRQILTIGRHQWEAVTTRGHAPEHLSLYCKALNLLISGDQVLPKITPNVSVSPAMPDDSPLADWLEAHVKVAQRVPDSVTVLPAHQLPFVGLHERLAEVVNHHQDRMDKILSLCDAPGSAQALTSKLFSRDLKPFQSFLAVGECVAHLHVLMAQGALERTLVDGVYLYKKCVA